jgi:hypothetical protein
MIPDRYIHHKVVAAVDRLMKIFENLDVVAHAETVAYPEKVTVHMHLFHSHSYTHSPPVKPPYCSYMKEKDYPVPRPDLMMMMMFT